LKCIKDGSILDPKEILRARQRLLNYPFFAVALDMGFWLGVVVIYFSLNQIYGGSINWGLTNLFRNLLIGIASSISAFFALEHVRRRHLSSVIFPDGGLYKIPGVFRTRIWTKIVALIMCVGFLPFSILALTAWRSTYAQHFGGQSPEFILDRLAL